MTRQLDVQWFENNRAALARDHAGRWLVVHQGRLRDVLDSEAEAVEFAVNEYGVDGASVFQAVARDPFFYIG